MERRLKECCMCGDTGFSDEIFQCRTCLYRFQHKYCSCLYLKTDSYQTCDWCLRSGKLNRKPSKQLKDFKRLYNSADEKESSCERSCPVHDQHAIKKQKSTGGVERPPTTNAALQYHNVSARLGQSQSKLIGNERIHNRQGGEGRSVRKGVTMSCKEDFDRKQQVQIPSRHEASTSRLVRGKVRRYKLLEEVSSWLKVMSERIEPLIFQ